MCFTLMNKIERIKLNRMTNEELDICLYKEFKYYEKDIGILCSIIRKTLPKSMIYRLISKLYRIRTTQN
jgi:hypothetical protein